MNDGIAPIMTTKPKRAKRLAITLCTLAAGLALVPAYLRAVTVSGPSDTPTLLLGDQLIVSLAAYDVRLPYSDTRIWERAGPRRGDMVMFHVPNRGVRGLKRVVGLGGDTVELRENVLIVNGRAVTQEPLDRELFASWVTAAHRLGETVVREAGSYTVTFTPGRSALRTTAAVTVPPGHYFLLGDHRDDSNDSRSFGPVERAHLQGRVLAHWRTARPKEMWPSWR